MKTQMNNPKSDKLLLDEIKKEFDALNGLRRKTIQQIYALGEKLDAFQCQAKRGVFEGAIKENNWGRTSVYDYKNFYFAAKEAAGRDNPLEFLDRYESYEHAKRDLLRSKKPSNPGEAHTVTTSIGNGGEDRTPFDVTPRIGPEDSGPPPPLPIGVAEITPQIPDLPEQQQEPKDTFSETVGQLLNLIRHAKVENKFKALKTLSELSMEIDILAEQLASEMVAA